MAGEQGTEGRPPPSQVKSSICCPQHAHPFHTHTVLLLQAGGNLTRKIRLASLQAVSIEETQKHIFSLLPR